MKIINEMEMSFKALSCNEGFARAAVAAFCVQLSPTIDEITDIKTAVSEAVTNSVVHAYPRKEGWVSLHVTLTENSVKIVVSDRGVGISSFEKAREPFFTSKPEQERSGMGFTVMESFMDSLTLSNNEGGGLIVEMEKKIGTAKKQIVG